MRVVFGVVAVVGWLGLSVGMVGIVGMVGVVRVAGVIEWSEFHICPCLHVCRGCHEPKVILVYIH